jgi:hypothetical protein
MNPIDREGAAARWAEEARRRAEEAAQARTQAPPTPPPAPDPARTARPTPEDTMERAPRLFGREIPLDLPVSEGRIEAPPIEVAIPESAPASIPSPDVSAGPRTDVLPRLTSPSTPRARLDADLDRQQLLEALGSTPTSPLVGGVATSASVITEATRALVAVRGLDWDKAAPALLGSKLRTVAEKAEQIELRAIRIKEALGAVETRHAPTLVGFKMAGGFLEKAAYKAALARELSSKLAPQPKVALERMAAARQELEAVQQNAGEAEATLRELAGKAQETPWALGEVREIQRAASTAQRELSQTESRGQMLAAMDAEAGLLAEAPAEASPAEVAPSDAAAGEAAPAEA